MRRLLIWLLAGVVSIACTVLAFFPAAWLGTLLELTTHQRLLLANTEGTLWHGSARVAADGNPAVSVLPGNFSWHISPLLLLGQVDAELGNPAALSQPIHITGNLSQWQISPAALTLSAEHLSALGAPLNTIQPTGQMRLSWQLLQLQRQQNAITIAGTMQLALHDVASRLSPVHPLGSYNLDAQWQGQQAQLRLTTVSGAMRLEGSGTLDHGHAQFSGTAQAAPGQEQKLANFLNLLGQHRQQDGHDVIALEFK